jgi:polyhydroxybutyrate depolymerase
LHGGGGNGEQVREPTGLHTIGVERGFVVAFPDGTGRLAKKLLTWNSGGIDVYAARNDVDDVGFLKSVVADIQKKVPINADRIYVVGHSNGGMMCHRLAREAADVFDGIAVVAGAMDFTAVDAQTPIAALLIHGTKDTNVRIAGGETGMRGSKRVDASLQDAADYYIARNGLVAYPKTDVEEGVQWARYLRAKSLSEVGPGTEAAAATPAVPNMTAPVCIVTLEGGGHAWPGSAHATRLLADQPHPWPASRHIVEFFAGLHADTLKKHSSPAAPR